MPNWIIDSIMEFMTNAIMARTMVIPNGKICVVFKAPSIQMEIDIERDPLVINSKPDNNELKIFLKSLQF